MEMKTETFQTLVFVNNVDKLLGKYAAIVPGMFRDFGGTEVPELMTMDATIDKMKLLFPDHDFSLVKLITVKLSEI